MCSTAGPGVGRRSLPGVVCTWLLRRARGSPDGAARAPLPRLPTQLYAVLIPAGIRCLADTNATNATGAGALGAGAPDCIEISNAEQGLLIGPCFTVPFLFGGAPLSNLADQYRRTVILAIALAVWSGMVMAAAAATSVTHLMLARAGLGAFQAVCNPCVYTLLSDIFPVSRRSTAFGIYHLGVYFGIGLSYVSPQCYSALLC